MLQSWRQRLLLLWMISCAWIGSTCLSIKAAQVFRAGVASVDVSPVTFPVIVNGNFTEQTATRVIDPLYSRALVLDDGTIQIALAVVDNCLIPREVIDQAKQLASAATGIPTSQMLVSATHTHSAASAMSCLGSRADTNYTAMLPGKVAESIIQAHKNRVPAQIGWTVFNAWDHTANRRWIRRPDRQLTDPFGQVTVRANMHPGHESPDAIGPSGPVDPGLTFLALRTTNGQPLALLANYSQHYYGAPAISSDYYGRFSLHMKRLLVGEEKDSPFVAMMSQGTSGDQMWMDYGAPRRDIGYDAYAQELAQQVAQAYQNIKFQEWVPLRMAERKLTLAYRVPDESRLAWARRIAASLGDKLPQTQPEIYAKEAIALHERQQREIILQALRIGELGIAAFPNEVYALTGLKVKARSPLSPTLNITVANGADGYIPPPEQHYLGGYTTWPARTAGLEVQAEPKILNTVLELLEEVAGKSRRPEPDHAGAYTENVLSMKPFAYWRMDEMEGTTARDWSGHNHSGRYEPGIAFFVPGAGSGTGISPNRRLTGSPFSGEGINRAVHFAGGRMTADLKELGPDYTVQMWFWNGLPPEARNIAGYLFSRGDGIRMGITGKEEMPGRLFVQAAPGAKRLIGKTEIPLKAWTHVALVRKGKELSLYLNGRSLPELRVDLDEAASPRTAGTFIFGGTENNEANFEGKIDEVAIYNRPLTSAEFVNLDLASRMADERTNEQHRKREQSSLRAQPQLPLFPAGYTDAVRSLKPKIHWQLNAASAGQVPDKASGQYPGRIEGSVEIRNQRAAQFSNGRIQGGWPVAGKTYTTAFWFCNMLPSNARAVTAYLFSLGPDGAQGAPGDHLGIGGSYSPEMTGRLIFFNGNERNQVLAGRTFLQPGSWNFVVLVRDGANVAVYLNGNPAPEISGTADVTVPPGTSTFFLGGRNDQFAPLTGYISEAAFFERALSGKEAQDLHQAAGTVNQRLSGPPAELPPTATQPLSPSESMKTFRLSPGYKAELVASEPLVLDPVAFDWDDAGRLWVVEMADYPMGMDGAGKPGGRIRVLEDSNGDGQYDRSTLYADGLNFPTGLLTWRDGVLVSAAPHILFLKDTDGDGRADDQQVLFSGFLEGNQQLRVNGLRWGLDNWVYCASGAHHGNHGTETKIKSHLLGKETLLGSRDFRFRPDTGELEPQSGPTQFGREKDDWGHWFGTQNSLPLWHYVLADHYLRRNPYVAAPNPVQQLIMPRNPPVHPISIPEKRFHSFNEAGHFTSACSGMIYRDTLLFPTSNATHAFICEPFHNLIHRSLLSDDSLSFRTERAPEERQSEWLASSDRWFRPVMIRTGPDGALYVADMYRYMIEHPDWLPPEGQAELLPHYRHGEDKGRIYRIVSVDRPVRPVHHLRGKTVQDCVAALESPNGWVRDKAQQVLLWRQSSEAVPLLEELAKRSSNPQAKVHALWTLAGLNALKAELIVEALSHTHSGVIENALRLAEHSSAPEVLNAVLKQTKNSDPKVRLQLAFSLGQWSDHHSGEALGELAVAHHANTYLTAAVMSSSVPHLEAIAQAVVRAGDPALSALHEPLLQLSLGLNHRPVLAMLLQPLLEPGNGRFTATQIQRFSDFLDLLARRKSNLETLAGSQPDALAGLLRKSQALFDYASKTAVNGGIDASNRITAAQLLGRTPSHRSEAVKVLAEFLNPREPLNVQANALRALAATADDRVPGTVLGAWAGLGPETRSQALDTLLSRELWTRALLDDLRAGKVNVAALDASRRSRLLSHSVADVRKAARELFENSDGSTRRSIVQSFQPTLSLSGNAQKGAAVYSRLCLNCHARDNAGRAIGPELRSVVNHSPEKLLASILDPNTDIQPGFQAYTCVLTNGEELYGLILSETANSITMTLTDGTTRSLSRQDIRSLSGSNQSLMPEGLEAGLNHQDMADLIAFIKSPEVTLQPASKE